MATLAVAGLSARLMAEAAARDGFTVIALDAFGDADTRHAAAAWRPIGASAALRIDATRTLSALRELAARGDVAGWVAGAGFDGAPHLLAHGARLLPLFGTAACNVRRLRDPATFFACLRDHAIAHPPTALQRPADPAGWLFKDAHGSGGWHIRDAVHAPAHVAAHQYFQQVAPGLPMSATFIANGECAAVLGCNELTVNPLGTRPFVYRGAVGSVPVAAAVREQVEYALKVLTGAFALRGHCSLDFMLDDAGRASVLEVNPRPPASLALYDGCVSGGLMAAHVAACRDGVLPARIDLPNVVRGTEIVFASHALQIDETTAATVARWPQAHDLPLAGSTIAAGAPLCSLSAAGKNAAQVRAALAAGREGLVQQLDSLLETTT